MGNWSVQVGGNALSWPRGSGLQVQATLDHREKIWLSGTVEGQCLQTTAGYMNGKYRKTSAILHKTPKNIKTMIMKNSLSLCADSGLHEELTVAACAGANRTFMLDVEKRDSSSKSETLGLVSVGITKQKLVLKASGCLESLTAVEV